MHAHFTNIKSFFYVVHMYVVVWTSSGLYCIQIYGRTTCTTEVYNHTHGSVTYEWLSIGVVQPTKFINICAYNGLCVMGVCVCVCIDLYIWDC